VNDRGRGRGSNRLRWWWRRRSFVFLLIHVCGFLSYFC
jgi:hypothetical protein